jgi:hypothetical protein
MAMAGGYSIFKLQNARNPVPTGLNPAPAGLEGEGFKPGLWKKRKIFLLLHACFLHYSII